jgi:flagellar biosynthesis chaperone FliJ
MSPDIEKYQRLIEKTDKKIGKLEVKIEKYEQKLEDARVNCAKYQEERRKWEIVKNKRYLANRVRAEEERLVKHKADRAFRESFRVIPDPENWEQFLPERFKRAKAG